MAVTDPVEIQVDRVSSGYGSGPFRRSVLHGVSFTASPGRVTAVVGPNGAGKTTLFRVLLGFHSPSAGSAYVGGLRPGVYRRRHGVGFLPESTPRPGGWTPAMLFEEGCHLQGLDAPSRREAIETAVDRSALSRRDRRTRLDRLSRGVVRRAVLAYALLGDPRVVVLDEPLAGLDPEARRRFRYTLEAVVRGGSCVLLSSHELGEVAEMSDSVMVLEGGRIARTLSGPTLGRDVERAVLDHGTGAGAAP